MKKLHGIAQILFYSFKIFQLTYISNSISPSRLLEIAQLIKETFPTEEIETYYVPYCHNKVTKKKALAKGKLHDKHGELRGILIRTGVSENRKGRKRKYVELSNNLRAICLGCRENFTTSEGKFLRLF